MNFEESFESFDEELKQADVAAQLQRLSQLQKSHPPANTTDNLDEQITQRASALKKVPSPELIKDYSFEYRHYETPDEPYARLSLPWGRDPSMKPTLWSIVKDNIGKELSRIALPVTINEPLGLT